MSTQGLKIVNIADSNIRTLANLADCSGARTREGRNDGIFTEEEIEYLKEWSKEEKYKELIAAIESDEAAKKEFEAILGGDFSKVRMMEIETEDEVTATETKAENKPVADTNSAEATTNTKSKKKPEETPTEKRAKRWEELKSITENELKSYVVLKHGLLNGKKLTAYDLLEEYLKKPGVKNDDGTYNLQKLGISVTQNSVLGIDATMNQNAHDSKISKEQSDAQGKLEKNLSQGLDKLATDKGVKKYNDKDEREIVENMVEFLGGTVEQNMHRLKEAAKRGVKDGLPAALMMLVNPANYVEQTGLAVAKASGETITEEQYRALFNALRNSNARTEEEITNIAKTVLGNETFAVAWVHQVVVSAFANAGIALGTTLLIDMIKDIAVGEERDELGVIKLDPFSSTTDPDDIKIRENLDAYLEVINGPAGHNYIPEAYKNTISEIAKKFVYKHCTGAKKDEAGNVVRDAEGKIVYEYEDKFDYAEMYAFFRENAGNDEMNIDELLITLTTKEGQESMQRHIDIMNKNAEEKNAKCKECDCDPVVNKPKEEPGKKQHENTVVTDVNGQVASDEIRYVVRDAHKSSWDKMATSYKCLQDLEKTVMLDARTGRNFTVAGRIMKLVQCIEDRNYSKERINALLNILSTAKTKKEFEEKVTELVGKNEAGKVNFDFENYYGLLGGNSIPSSKSRFPLELMGCPYEEQDLSVPKAPLGKVKLNAGKGIEDDNMRYAYKDPNGTWIKCSKTVYEQKVALHYETKKWPDTGLK